MFKAWKILSSDSKARGLLTAALFILAVEGLSYFLPGFPPRWASLLLLVFAVLLARAVLIQGFKALVRGRFSSISLLITIASMGAVWLGQWLEAAVVLSLFAVSEALEEHGFQQSYAALQGLLADAPQTAEVEGLGSVPIDSVVPGQRVLVKPGERVPVDGRIEVGFGLIDEASITGEPIPVSRGPQDRVFAGTLSLQGHLTVKAEKAGKDSTLQRIVAITYEAAEQKLALQSFIERFARWYTPLIMALSTGMILWAWINGQPLGLWVERSLTLLVIACPCALTMATPVAVFAAVSAANRKGVVIKGGAPLEALARLRTLGMDKTRTLTSGKPRVEGITAFRDWDQREILAAAAGLEALTTHPVAKAVLEEALRQGVEPHGIRGFEEHSGRGVQGECVICRDSHHCLGNPGFSAEEHAIPAPVLAQIEAMQAAGLTVIVLSDSQGPVGAISITDALRPESPATVKEIQGLGVNVILLTGDHAHAAKAVAKACGIDDVRAGLLPQDKASAIKALGPGTGMVGDGINDAPALAMASVGIAMGASGAALAEEHAGVLLLQDRLDRLPYLIRLGRKTLATIRWNSALAVGAKLAVLGLAVLGHANLDLAILSDVGLTVLVIWRGLALGELA